MEIGEWLLDRGMDPDARGAIDADGFGGYTALYATVVSQRNFWVNYGKGQPDEARFTRLLLERGADPDEIYDITVADDWVWVCYIFGFAGTVVGYQWVTTTDLSGDPVTNLTAQVTIDLAAASLPHAWMTAVDRDGVAWAVGNSAFDDNTRIYRISQGGSLTVYEPGITAERSYLAYDETDHALLITDDNFAIHKWSIDAETIVAATPNNVTSSYQQQTFKAGPQGRSLWTIGSGFPGFDYYEIDVDTMGVRRTIEGTAWEPTPGTPLGVVYDSTSHALWITAASAALTSSLIVRPRPGSGRRRRP